MKIKLQKSGILEENGKNYGRSQKRQKQTGTSVTYEADHNKASWRGKVSTLAQTGRVVETNNSRINLRSPIFQQVTTLPGTGNQQQHNYPPSYLNVNQNYQEIYSTTSTNMLPFVSTAPSIELNPMILNSTSIVQPVDEKLSAAQLKAPVKSQTISGPSRNLGEFVESNRKICAESFPTQSQPDNHLNIQQQHATCYDYNAMGTRFALLIESLKSSMAKNSPNRLIENSKSLADTIQLYQQQAAANIQHQGVSISSNNNNNSNNATNEFSERHQLSDNLQHLASLHHPGQQSGNLQGRYISDENYHLASIERRALNSACLSQNYATIKINQTNSTSNSSASSSPRN